MVELPCPLCGGVAASGTDIGPGACACCGGRFAGGLENPPDAVEAAAAEWGAAGVDARLAADGLFRLEPGHPLLTEIGVTSDRRDGFYRWWVFVAAGADPGPCLNAAAGHGVPRG